MANVAVKPKPRPAPAVERPPRTPRRFLRRTRRALVALTACALIAHTWWAWSAERALDREVAAYAAAGEPIYPADVAEPAVAEADNAVPLLREAGRALNSSSFEWRTFSDIDAGWAETRGDAPQFQRPPEPDPAAAGAGVRANPPPARPPTPFLTDAYARAVRAVLTANDPALRKVDLALARPGAWWGPRDPARPLLQSGRDEIANALHLASLLRAAALAAHHDGDEVDALRRTGQILTLARIVDRQAACPAHAIACAIASLAAKTAAQIAPGLRLPTPAAPMVANLAARFLDAAPTHDAQAAALRFTRVMLWDTAKQIAGGRADLLRTAQDGPAIRAGRLGCYACKPLLMDDAALMVRYTSGVLAAAARASDWPEFYNASPPDPADVAAWPRLHFLAVVLIPDFKWYVRGHFRALAQCRLAAVALAAGDYAYRHDGRPPAALADLTPAYLPYAPRDPMAANGRPIGWARSADGRVRIYSVGDDGVDDGGSSVRGGDPAATGPRVWGAWDQRDFVVRLGHE